MLARYSLFGLGWSVFMAFFAIGFTLRYKPIMEHFAPDYVVWAVLVTLWVGFFIPVIVIVFKPLATPHPRRMTWRRPKPTSPRS